LHAGLRKTVRLAGSSALAIATVLGWPAVMAFAGAPSAPAVTSGLLNQGLPPGPIMGLPGLGGGATQAVAQTTANTPVGPVTSGVFSQGPPAGGLLPGAMPPGLPAGGGGAVTAAGGSTGGVTGGVITGVTGGVTGGVITGVAGGVTSGLFGAGAPLLPPSVLFPAQTGTLPSGGGAAPTAGQSPASAPAPGPGSGGSQDDPAYVIGLVNQQRALVDAQPLALDPALNALAQERAQVLAADGTLTHDVPGYGYADAMEQAAGIQGTLLGAEDLATGNTVYQAFWMLMTSDWHRANLLYASYNAAGVGVAAMSDGTVVLDILFIER
jgi:uncharacterized protein YkwD